VECVHDQGIVSPALERFVGGDRAGTFAAIGPGQPDVPNGNDNESIETKRKP
jgi:hypothetical protein